MTRKKKAQRLDEASTSDPAPPEELTDEELEGIAGGRGTVMKKSDGNESGTGRGTLSRT